GGELLGRVVQALHRRDPRHRAGHRLDGTGGALPPGVLPAGSGIAPPRRVDRRPAGLLPRPRVLRELDVPRELQPAPHPAHVLRRAGRTPRRGLPRGNPRRAAGGAALVDRDRARTLSARQGARGACVLVSGRPAPRGECPARHGNTAFPERLARDGVRTKGMPTPSEVSTTFLTSFFTGDIARAASMISPDFSFSAPLQDAPAGKAAYFGG